MSTPGDASERDADRAADRILNSSDRDSGPPGAGPDQERPRVVPNGSAGGDRLSDSSLAYFGPRFAHDFSGVRVHTKRTAATSAAGLGARAYTVGSNIVFDKGQYNPESSTGRGLLAHELAHVVQQSRSQRPQINRWTYGTGRHPLGGGTTFSEITADERTGSNGTDAAMAIVGRVVANPGCSKWFTDNCTDVPTATLAELNTRAVIWMWRTADGSGGSLGGTEVANGENHAFTETLFNKLSRWSLASTMIHEYWHDCETGQADIGDDAKAACGLPNEF